MTTTADAPSIGLWAPARRSWCICPDYVLRRLVRHTPWRAGCAFVCQCGAVWRYSELVDA